MFKVKKTVIFLILLSFLSAYLGGEKILYLIFYTITGVFFLSFLSFRHTTKALYGYQSYESKDYYVGDEIEIQSYIYNDTLLPIPYLEITDESLENIINDKARYNSTFLKPNDKEIIKTKFTAKFRGIYELGPIKVKTSDVFNVFSSTKIIYTDKCIKIYPRVYILNRFDLKSMQSFGSISTKQRAYEDNTSISDIKKYSNGDSIKKIHWKISAKKGGLYIKNYNMSGNPICHVFLDLRNNCFTGKSRRELEERAVEAVISIILHMLKCSISVNLFVNSKEIYYESARDVKEFTKFMDMLLSIKSGGDNSIGDIIQKRLRIINFGSSIIIVTGIVTKEDVEIYCNVRAIGYDVILVYVSQNEMEKGIRLSLGSSGVKVYFIKPNSNVKEVLDEYEAQGIS